MTAIVNVDNISSVDAAVTVIAAHGVVIVAFDGTFEMPTLLPWCQHVL